MRTTVDLTREPLTDAFNRPISYLRVSVTDKCNLRCVYCMPESGLPWLHRDELLSYEEIVEIVRAAAHVGVRAIRLTGGEPLVRRDLHRLVAGINAIEGIDDIALSTNAVLLEEQLDALVAAGLRRVNISLDTLRPDRFERIARRPGLDGVLRGIDAAIAAGVAPVKLNCVVMRGENDDEIGEFAQLTRERAVYVRFIEVMPVHENLELQRDTYVSSDEILERVAAVERIEPVAGPLGNGPARYFAYPGAPGAVGCPGDCAGRAPAPVEKITASTLNARHTKVMGVARQRIAWIIGSRAERRQPGELPPRWPSLARSDRRAVRNRAERPRKRARRCADARNRENVSALERAVTLRSRRQTRPNP